jgi:hypothetical protein
MRLGRLLLLAAVKATVIVSAIHAAQSRPSVIVQFHTPSNNIGCAYVGSGGKAQLRCDILSSFKPAPPKPRSCEFDWAGAVGMNTRGRAAVLCISDTVFDKRSPTLRYGQTWRRGGFTCTSRSTGLTCRNPSGHGWVLSRQRSRIF